MVIKLHLKIEVTIGKIFLQSREKRNKNLYTKSFIYCDEECSELPREIIYDARKKQLWYLQASIIPTKRKIK